MNRIFVWGGVGSGKTTFAKKLSRILKIPVFSTDEMVYDDSEMRKNSKDVRDKAIRKVESKESWIVEGVHMRDWIKKILMKADTLVVLDYEKKILYKNIVERFKQGRRKKAPHGKIISFLHLIWWAFMHKSKDFERIREFFPKGVKLIIFNNPSEADLFLKKLN